MCFISEKKRQVPLIQQFIHSEEVPVKYEHLQPIIANLAMQGPVTTVPLPHLVHTKHAGWLA